MKNIYVVPLLVISSFLLLTGMGSAQETGKGDAGREEFQTNCSSCHPKGGNVIKPGKPIKDSKKLANAKVFLGWIRKPVAPMPSFPAAKISDQQADELYRYIVMAAKNEWK